MLLLLACILPSSTSTELDWYLTCGDPVCNGYQGPFDGVPACTDETVGEPCAVEGETCDPHDSCDALVICASEDPTTQEGGCPISRRDAKRDIHYLDPAERKAVADATLDVRLATWSYKTDPAQAPPHLGFILDDGPPGFAVAADGGHVDLYGFTSLTLATLQEQEARIDAQDRELAELRARLTELERRR